MMGILQRRLSLDSRELAYTIECRDSGISVQDGKFVVTQAGAAATLQFEGMADSETYISIDGLDFQGVPAYDLYFGTEDVDPAAAV